MNLYELKRRFTYHPPILRLKQPERFENIRKAALTYAELIVDATPESREQSVAIAKLEECVFWANAAIARNEVDIMK